jgi:Protein of unknown function (DUF2695)
MTLQRDEETPRKTFELSPRKNWSGCLCKSDRTSRMLATRKKENTMPEVLTPENPRWEQFTAAMLDSMKSMELCDGDARQAEPDKVHRHAKAVMTAMGDIDIAATLAFFEAHGGYCDCEILLNVDPDWNWMSPVNGLN